MISGEKSNCGSRIYDNCLHFRHATSLQQEIKSKFHKPTTIMS
uniref:Uncharacterized protein n=1 Tax=Arundo donax TaxID=35708 RepID=A0A0A9FNZ2_ARUDO